MSSLLDRVGWAWRLSWWRCVFVTGRTLMTITNWIARRLASPGGAGEYLMLHGQQGLSSIIDEMQATIDRAPN